MFYSSPFLYSMYTLIAASTVLTILSPNWLMAWIMLEINMLSFLPIICMTKSNQETEAATKYFLIQALGSLLLLTGSTMIYQPNMGTFMYSTLSTALLMKLGAFPCHFWYPSVMSSISWSNCMILSTWQKLAPLSLLSVVTGSMMSPILMTLASMNALIGGLLGMNQTHLRPLLAYSSIGHLGWILAMISMNKTMIWITYFSIYCTLVIPVFMMMMMLNISTIYDLYNLFKLSYTAPIITALLMLSLAGLPPLTGFLPKLLVISHMMESNYFSLLMLLIGSYMNLYYYMSISLASLMSVNSYHKSKKQKTKLSSVTALLMAALPLLGVIMIII